MAQLLVGDLDDRVIEGLAAKAARKGHSIEDEAREILTAAALLAPEEKVALFRAIRAKGPILKNFDAHGAIRGAGPGGADA